MSLLHRAGGGGVTLAAAIFPAPIGSIQTWGWESASYGAPPAGGDAPSFNSNLGTNFATYVPFTLNATEIIKFLGWENGTTVSGNVDCGIYDLSGNRLVSTGATLQAGVSLPQVVDIPDTTLVPGNYFQAIAQDNATGLLKSFSMAIQVQEILGVKQQATAFPLPAVATFAAPSKTVYPQFGGFLGQAV